MTSVSVFCCLRGCLDGFGFPKNAPHIPQENPIQLDTAFMGWLHQIHLRSFTVVFLGYEVVIVKGGHRVCGSGAALGNAPLVQSKSYFEVKIQQGGGWSVGLATRQTDLSLTKGLQGFNIICKCIIVWVLGGMDEFSWTLSHDGVINHNTEELYKMGNTDVQSKPQQIPQEGDVIGISYDHIQLKFYVNGEEVEYAVTNVKGTVYPALYGK